MEKKIVFAFVGGVCCDVQRHKCDTSYIFPLGSGAFSASHALTFVWNGAAASLIYIMALRNEGASTLRSLWGHSALRFSLLALFG